MAMSNAEIELILQAITIADPIVKDVYNKIAANMNGTVRPIEEIFADTDAQIQQGIDKANAELSSGDTTPGSSGSD